jgi:predicted hydrolase (HD superfamily)
MARFQRTIEVEVGWMNRDEALALLHEYTQSESLRKHAYAVEAAMRAYAREFGADEARWG